MTKYNIPEVCTSPMTRDSWLAIFLMHVMSEHSEDSQDWRRVFGDIQNVDVKVTINGVEVSFDCFLKELERQHGAMLKAEAKALFNEMFGNVEDTLQKMQRMAEERLDECLPSWEKERRKKNG